MSEDEEMRKALEADGEKLRQLTGEDHGPHEYTISAPSRCFARMTKDAILIDWPETERQRDSNMYARLLLAIRDGTWLPLEEDE